MSLYRSSISLALWSRVYYICTMEGKGRQHTYKELERKHFWKRYLENTEGDLRAALRLIVIKSIMKMGSRFYRFLSNNKCYWYLQCSAFRFDYHSVSPFNLRSSSSRISTTIGSHMHNADGSLAISHLHSCLILVIVEELGPNQVSWQWFLHVLRTIEVNCCSISCAVGDVSERCVSSRLP
jgi:hypothetical protein